MNNPLFHKRKKRTRNELILLFIFYLIYLLFSFHSINDLKNEQFQEGKKLEITGYFKKIESAYKDKMIITLTNEDQYSIDSFMYLSKAPVFQIDEFVHEVKYGDRLCFVVLENDKSKKPFIYQLECNGKEYISYSAAMNEIQRNNKGGVLVFIIMDVIVGALLVFDLIKYMVTKKKEKKVMETPKCYDEFKEVPEVVRANVSGKVLRVYVSKNQVIKKGEMLLIIEAAQMQVPVVSPVNGIIKDIYVNEWDKVQKNEEIVLVKLLEH